jgi:hypothetical protein
VGGYQKRGRLGRFLEACMASDRGAIEHPDDTADRVPHRPFALFDHPVIDGSGETGGPPLKCEVGTQKSCTEEVTSIGIG